MIQLSTQPPAERQRRFGRHLAHIDAQIQQRLQHVDIDFLPAPAVLGEQRDWLRFAAQHLGHVLDQVEDQLVRRLFQACQAPIQPARPPGNSGSSGNESAHS